MKILFTIPHYYRPSENVSHGSGRTSASERVHTLTRCLLGLHQTFGRGQVYIGQRSQLTNDRLSQDIKVVICTTGAHHLLDSIESGLFSRHSTTAEPLLLGYECHEILKKEIGRYDYYCFLEDDLLISDAMLFWKLGWFSSQAGEECVLQPHRFELSSEPPIRKLYIDGPLVDQTISRQFQDMSVRPTLKGTVLGQAVEFGRVDNPHAGCFFLSARQMEHWAKQPYFMDYSAGFWGPLESAATLGIMRAFRTYKPHPSNAGFLEVQHLDKRYLGTRVRFATAH